jgi:dTMP kinase
MRESQRKQGFFITFEGGEGSGKSSQVKVLATFLGEKNRSCVVTREPGGTAEAEKIRNLLVEREGGNWSAMEECLLLFAARAHHVRTLIQPALLRGEVVISDRFTDSTRAYQGYGLGASLEHINALNQLCLDGFEPDLTILLDVPAGLGLERSKGRLAAQSSTEDKYENLDLAFHERMRLGFLELAAQNPQRFVVIDAAQGIEVIQNQVALIIAERAGL